MEPSDRFPEETIGTVAMIRKRQQEFEGMADALDAEAREQTMAVARMRKRAERLREQALEYRAAAHALEAAGPGPEGLAGLRAPIVHVVAAGEDFPDGQPGDDLMAQDPVDPTTYRRYWWVENQWTRREVRT